MTRLWVAYAEAHATVKKGGLSHAQDAALTLTSSERGDVRPTNLVGSCPSTGRGKDMRRSSLVGAPRSSLALCGVDISA